jgi:hypothetical protein
VNYAKLLEMNSFFTLHSFLEVGKTQDLPSKFWQTLGDAQRHIVHDPFLKLARFVGKHVAKTDYGLGIFQLQSKWHGR